MESNTGMIEENSSINIESNVEVKEEKVEEKKLGKINLPKRKYAIIHGYSGHNYSGNQKNPDVKTVEDEMEKTLFKLNYISECNYGVLQKIHWMRASRTDKKVSAIMNVVSCKLHKFPDQDETDIKRIVNEQLPKDIKIFRVIEVSNSFDSKASNNNREYHYIIPSFMLEPKSLSISSPKGVSIDTFVANYEYKITPEFHEKVKEICKFFKGTKKYHNYTRNLKFADSSSQRHIYELSCDELIDYKNFQGIKFKIVGQSFLYNQIRKMIGGVVDMCREGRDFQYLENTFLANRVDVPKAPAEGLYLYRIDYSRYNDRKATKKNPIYLTEQDEKEMEDFRLELWSYIENAELNDRVFSKWLWKLENSPENVY